MLKLLCVTLALAVIPWQAYAQQQQGPQGGDQNQQFQPPLPGGNQGGGNPQNVPQAQGGQPQGAGMQPAGPGQGPEGQGPGGGPEQGGQPAPGTAGGGNPALACGAGGPCPGMGAATVTTVPFIVPSDKGGVIVLYQGMLYKYDKDLKMIKKIPIGQ